MAPSTTLYVRLTPRGGRDAVDGWMRDADDRAVLKVRVAAPPVEGSANAALIRLLARTLGVPSRAVRIAAGAQSRIKRVDIDGLDAAALAAALGRSDEAERPAEGGSPPALQAEQE